MIVVGLTFLGSINNKAHGCPNLIGFKKTRGVSRCGLAIIYIKRYLMAKEKNYENSSISPSKNIIFIKKIL